MKKLGPEAVSLTRSLGKSTTERPTRRAVMGNGTAFRKGIMSKEEGDGKLGQEEGVV
jgi:hypothetical protein